jgi:hypothetical protein
VSPLELPPLEPLRELLARLERAALPHAIGASGLLAALGLVERVNDWDVTVDADIDTLAAVTAGVTSSRHGHGGGHADHKLSFERERVELIARFAFFTPAGVVRIPTIVTRRWQDLPIGSPCAWAVAYALMAENENNARRRERSELLFAWLEEHGADAGRALLLEQPLPLTLRTRLEALPSA